MIDQPLQLHRTSVDYEFGKRFRYFVDGVVPPGTAVFVVSSSAVILGVDINNDETARVARLGEILSIDPNVWLEIAPEPSTTDRWAIQRTDARQPMFLSPRGTWITIATAMWFDDESAAERHALRKCPAGTTGTPIQVGYVAWTEPR